MLNTSLGIQCFNLFGHAGAETGIFQGNWVNTMAGDDLAPCDAKLSEKLVLTM